MTKSMDIEVDEYEGLDFEQLAREQLEQTAIRTQQFWRDNLRDAGWVDRGEAVNDVTVVQVDETTYKVGGDVIQLAIAEFGRAPGSMPPHDAISEWARRKNLTPNEDQDWDGMVYAIRKAIAEDGIEGHAAGQRAARKASKRLESEMKDRIDRDLERQS